MIDLNIRRIILAGLCAATIGAGCRAENKSRAELPGVLGYAEFVLQCEEESCAAYDEFPPFAIGSRFDFDIRYRRDFPDHQHGVHLEIHEAALVEPDGSQMQTLLAVSNHRDGYLVDYAHVRLYAADDFRVERPDGTPLDRDGETYLLPPGEPTEARVIPQRDGIALAGEPQLSYDAVDRDVLALSGLGDDRIELLPVSAGEAEIEVDGAGHVQTLQFRISAGARTNPSPSDPRRTNPAEPRRTNPDAETDTDGGGTDTETDGGTGGAE